MFTRKHIVIALLLLAAFTVSLPSVVLAQPAEGENVGAPITAADLGLYYGEGAGLGTADIRVTIVRIIRIALSVLGVIALLVVLAGGVVWMTAGGNEEKVTTAKKIMINGVIGLAIILSSYAITQFIINSLTDATGGALVGEGAGGAGGIGGFGGRGCANPPCGGNNFVVKISPKGAQRVQNVLVKINFSERGRVAEYDPASVQVGDSIKLYKTDDRERVQIPIDLVQVSASEIHLRGKSACPAPQENTLECFDANSSYTVELTTAVKSAGGRDLYCPLAGDVFSCKRVFIAGDQFDADPPTIVITNYRSGESIPLGGTVDIKTRARDEFGVDTIQYKVNDVVAHVSDLENNPADASDTFVFEVDADTYRPLEAISMVAEARDVDGHMAATEPVRLIPRPEHCFNRVKDADEAGPDCGGEFCGACAGAVCRGDGDCAGGFCRVPQGANVGICVDLPLITDVTPGDGAPGTVVTIEGRRFGAEAGQVLFYNNPADPASAVPSGAACGESWGDGVITVSVPNGLDAGKAAPLGVRTKAGDEDRTDDARGATFDGVFAVNETVRPGLCRVNPDFGLLNDKITASGVNIGNGVGSAFLYDGESARVDVWNQDQEGRLGEIRSFVPNISTGRVMVQAQVGENVSNPIPFEVRAFREEDRPRLVTVSPERGPIGTYVTLSGSGFGATGQGSAVVFKNKITGAKKFADVDFPAECGEGTWNDQAIVVKVPKDADFGGAENGVASYEIFLERGAARVTSNALDFGIAARGEPTPGICKIDPGMRPIGGTIDIYGEYFGNDAGSVIFWDANATQDVASWTAADVRAVGAVWDESGRHASVTVPASAISGPVKVVRKTDQAQSNGYNFFVGNCLENRNQCPVAGTECCASGFYTGSCEESCAAAARTAEYSWIFSTGKVPLIPDVVQCCGRNCPLANNLPSPSPWSGHPDSQQVCVNALIRGTFTTTIDTHEGDPVGKFVLEKCAGEGNNPCAELEEVHRGAEIRNGAGNAEFRFAGEHTPNMEANTTYQVRILEGLSALPDAEEGRPGGVMRPDPEAIEACGGDRLARGTAYCFRFRTNASECELGAVTITPVAFTAKELGILVQDDDNNVVPEIRQDDRPLYNAGAIAAGNQCVTLDPAQYNWSWDESSNGAFAQLLQSGPDGGHTRFVRAAKPTEEPITISATAVGKTGSGVLNIAPGDPQIIAAWPQCQVACTNTTLGVSFNIPMNARTLGAYQGIGLYKCRDEFCRYSDILDDIAQ